MKSLFSTPEYTLGTSAEVPVPQPNTESRTWGEFATDVAIDAVARPVVGAARTLAQGARGVADDSPTARSVEQGLGAAEHWLESKRSARAQSLDTQSIDPRGNERSYWDAPVEGAVHAFLPSVPYALAALWTGGGSLAARTGSAAAMGALGAGEALNDLRDYAEQTPIADLQKSPVFQKFFREFNGDEQAARQALFKEMLDPKSQAVNFLVNAMEVPAFRLGMRPSGSVMRIVDRVKAAGLGAVTGGVQGAAEEGTEAYIRELGQVRAGQQEAIDPNAITSGVMSGAIFAGPTAAFHAIAPTYKAAPLGADTTAVAAGQVNQPATPPQQPPQAAPAPASTPPGGGMPPPAPPGVVPGASSGRYGPGLPLERAGPRLPKEQAGPPRPTPEQMETYASEQYGPPTEPEGPPIAPQPQPFPDPYALWAGESFSAPVQVLDRPPVYQNGEWMQPVRYTNPRTRRTQVMLAPASELQQMAGPERGMGPNLPEEKYGPPEYYGPEQLVGPPQPTLDQLEGQRARERREEQRQWNTAVPPPRQGIHFTGLERALDTAIQLYHRGEQSTADWNSLRTRAIRLEAMRQRNGMPTAHFLDELGPPPGSPEQRARNEAMAHRQQLARVDAVRDRRMARQQLVERRQQAASDRAARRAERPTGFDRHPLMGGMEYEPRLRSDVEAFNKRAKAASGQPIAKAARAELDIDRRVLQERVDKYNAGAEPADRITLAEAEGFVTQSQKRKQEFDEIKGQLEQATKAELTDPGRRPHLQQLVNRLISLGRGRQYQMVAGERPREMTVREALRRRGPTPVALEDRPKIAVWTAGERWQQLAAEVQRRERELRKSGKYRRTHTTVGEGEYLARYGRMPVDTIEIAEPTRGRQERLSISPELAAQLEKYGLVSTPERISEASRRSQEETNLLKQARERQAADIEARKRKRGRRPTGTGPVDIKGMTKKEARRTVSAALKARKAEEYKPSGKAPGRRTGMMGEVWTRIFRKSWQALPGWKKLEIRRDARIQGTRNLEQFFREEYERREETARQRELKGLPRIHPFGRLPSTVAEMLEEFRAGQQREKGRVARAGTAEKYLKARETIIGDAVTKAITQRFGSRQKFDAFMADLHTRSQSPRPVMPATGRTAKPNMLVMNKYHERLGNWLRGREQLVKDVGRLRTFLDHTISTINRDLQAYRKDNDIKGRDSLWRMAEPIRGEEGLQPSQQAGGGAARQSSLARLKYRGGKVGVEQGRYNFGVDIQNMSEGLRYMQANLDALPKAALRTVPPAKVYNRLSLAGKDRIATRFEEFNRYTAVLGKELRDFTANFDLFLKGELKLIENERKQRSEEATAGFRGVTQERTRAERDTDSRREATGTPEDFLTPAEDFEPEEAEDAPAQFARSERETTAVGQRAIEQAAEEEKPAEEKSTASEPFEIIPAGLQPQAHIDPVTGEELLPDIHAVPIRQGRGGGGQAALARGVNIIEQQMFDNAVMEIQRKEQLALKRAERTGLFFDPEQLKREKAAELHREFPLRTGRVRYTGKVRPGMPMGQYDAEGLPIDRIKRDEFEPYTAEEQRYLDAHDELNNSSNPVHPMITPVEETQGVMDRVKDMVAKGQTGIVPAEYVTDQFLDQLAAITSDTAVYHAPYDAVSALDGDAPGHYSVKHDRVVIPYDVSPDYYVRAALHETMHAATHRSLLTDPAFYNSVAGLMKQGIATAKRRGHDLDFLPRDLYGLSSPAEFLSELVSNKNFRDFLSTVITPRQPVIQGIKNALNAAYHAIRQALRRVFGNAKDADTGLDILFYDQSTVLGQADAMVKRKMKQLRREGRPDYNTAMQALEEEDQGRVYMNLSDGARAFVGGLKETFDRTKFQLDKVRSDHRAPGMGWRTMFDQTQIGSQEFKNLTGEFHEVFERLQGAETQMRDADKREIAELARIWNSWSREGREEAGRFMIDEGMHTAWADAPIGEYGPEYLDQETGERKRDLIGKNAFIDPTLLKNAQIVHEHTRGPITVDDKEYKNIVERMRDVEAALPPMAAVGKRRGHGGFKEFRERVYKFTSAREEDIRRNNIRDQWVVSGFLPDNLSAAQRDRILDVLRDWSDYEIKGGRRVPNYPMTPADMRVLRDAGIDVRKQEMIDLRDKVHAAKEFARIQGPYSPFTRYGDWALTGRFNIEKPDNALLLKEDINEATGQPVDDARFVFPTEDDAKEMVRNITDKHGVAQLDGGTIWIDTTTGERPRVPDKRHAGKERIATESEIENHPNSEKIEQYYYVTFQPKHLEMHGSQFEAEQRRQQLLASERFKDKMDLSLPQDVYRHDARQNEHYTSTQMQNLINTVRASDAYQRLDPNEQAAISRNMNLASEKFALRRGFKQRYLPRNYVSGATTQVLSSLDDYSTTSSRYLGKVKYASQLEEKGKKIKEYLKRKDYPKDGDDQYVAERRVYNAMMRRIHSPTQNPHDTGISRLLDRGMRVTMLDKLPNVAYFTVNATETGTIGIPMMSGRHGVGNVTGTMGRMFRVAGLANFVKAAKNDLAQAVRRGTDMTDYLNLYNEAIDAAGNRVPFADGTKDLLKQARDRNLIDASASLEYQSSFATNRKKIDVALDWGQGVFQAINSAIENMNRFVTLATAYDLEMRRLTRVAEGKAKPHADGEASFDDAQRHKAASEYAMTMLHQVNGVYANYNAPEFFRREGPLGMLGPVVFQFKKWPQRITMIYLRAGLGMLKGFADLARQGKMTPEHREAARQFIYMVAMVGLVAGAMGMPLEPFSHTINLAYIMGLSRYNWDDVQTGFRVWMQKHGGSDMAQLISHGPLSFLTGVDFAGRMGQSSMWAYGSPGSTKVKDLQGSLMGLLGGATMGTAAEVITGMQKGFEATGAFASGAHDVGMKKTVEFLKGVTPLRLASDVLGSFAGAEGTELSSGRKLGPNYTLFERAVRAGGFTPTRESESREARNAIVSLDKREAAGRKTYIDRFTSSPPGAQREAVWRTIQNSWNPVHPGYEITREDLLKADRTRRKAKSESRDQLGIPQNKRIGSLMPITEAYGIR